MKEFKDFSNLIHKEGFIFILAFAAVTFLLSSFSSKLGVVGFVMTSWCVYFFRNPDRYTPISDDLIVSPADGILQSITKISPPPELNLGVDNMLRISIFLNVFNVHVNRVPATGKILKLHYNPGKFFNASLDKASIHNERQSVLMETGSGQQIVFVQIAGLIARRIVCELEEGKEVEVGERYGIIRFGSRVDVYLPEDTALLVTEGQVCIGGETVLADLKMDKSEQLRFVKK